VARIADMNSPAGSHIKATRAKVAAQPPDVRRLTTWGTLKSALQLNATLQLNASCGLASNFMTHNTFVTQHNLVTK